MENNKVTIEFSGNEFSFTSPKDFSDKVNEATASILNNNPTVSWAKFVLTDSSPNGNRQRVPLEEFGNVLSSGLFMPLKMAVGRINEGHDEAEPLGVITNLVQKGDKIEVLAAMWAAERPEDIQLLKDRIAVNQGIDISWEILYGYSTMDDVGIETLHDVTLRAATIVGVPAYEGRTPVLAIAARARKWSPAYLNKLGDTAFLYVRKLPNKDEKERLFPYRDGNDNVDIKRLKESLEETATSNLPENVLKGVRVRAKRILSAIDNAEASLELDSTELMEETTLNELTELQSKYDALAEKAETDRAGLETTISELKEQIAGFEQLTTELAELRTFKSEFDAEQAKAEKLSNLKEKFEAVGLEKGEEYFVENSETLLKMDEASLDFLMQEMIAFAELVKTSSESESQASRYPNLASDARGTGKVVDLAKALRESEKSSK